jgi:hypothetical protein
MMMARFRFGSLDEAVGAIKARVQECGGRIIHDDALARARLVHAEEQHQKRKAALFASQEWITETVHPAVEALLACLVNQSKYISTEAGIRILVGSDGRSQCALTNDLVSIAVSWHQPYTNVMGHLEVQEFSQRLILPGENRFYPMGPPSSIETIKILPDISLIGELCWQDENKPDQNFTAEGLVNVILNRFISLVQQGNLGTIDTTPEFYRQLRQAQTEYDPFGDE